MQQLKIVASDRVKDNEAFMQFVRTLPETFDLVGNEIHRARNLLKIIEVVQLGVAGLERVMVKRYHKLFFFQKIDYTYIRQPKCRKAYDNTVELHRRGFEAAEELAYVEVWNHGFYQYAFFVSEVGRGERLDQLAMDLSAEGKNAAVHELTHQFAAFVYSMHQHGILYRDMNPGNVLCRKEGNENDWRFCLIDTNRAQFYGEDEVLPLETCIPDLILMNPKTGIVEDFIAEYLRLRGMYSEEEVARIRECQRKTHEKKRPVKKFLKRYKQKYYKWLG